MEIIVEVVNRSQRALEVYRFNQSVIRIGRAYDNDIILSDPHVSPHHAILSHDPEQGWRLRDISSLNGTYSRQKHDVIQEEVCQSGDEFILGRVRLRMLLTSHPVAETLPLDSWEPYIRRLNRLPYVMLLMMFAFSIFIWGEYRTWYEPMNIQKLLITAVLPIFIATLWGLLWSFVGRVLRHDGRFLAHVSIALVFMILLTFFDEMVEVIAFNSANLLLQRVLAIGGYIIGLFVLLWGGLYLASNFPARRRTVMSMALSASIISFLAFAFYVYQPDFSEEPDYVRVLKPPAYYATSSVSIDEFLKASLPQFDKVAFVRQKTASASAE
ncbi:MAG: FHA domain-containing protein [Gammaproteobacteria bacterium]|nr:FHA domain-containing protein [Gammaproteobacteria bacterium]